MTEKKSTLSKATEDETVTWMPDAADQVTEETVGHAVAEGVPLTPAQVSYSDEIGSEVNVPKIELCCILLEASE